MWKVPYLPVDPYDLGSNYEAIIRVNSQSGKGGVAWTLLHELQIQLPKGLQMHSSKVVNQAPETTDDILSPTEVKEPFLKRYHISEPDPRILSATLGHSDQSFFEDECLNLDKGQDVDQMKASVAEATKAGLSIPNFTAPPRRIQPPYLIVKLYNRSYHAAVL